MVLFGLAGSAIGLVTAGGRVTLSAPLLQGGSPWFRLSPNERYILLYSSNLSPGELALYEVGFGLRWYHQLEPSERWTTVSSLSVSDAGLATALLGDDTLSFELTGALTKMPTVSSQDEDDDGWVPSIVQRDTEYGRISERVFENVDSGELRPLTHEPVNRYPFPYLVDETYYYFANLDSEITLVHETATSVELIPTSLAYDETASFDAKAGWFWVERRGAPAWRFDRALELAETVQYLVPSGSNDFEANYTEDFVLVTQLGAPRYRVDLSTLELLEFEQLGSFDTWQILWSGPWAVGSGVDGPHWRVNVHSGVAESIDLSEFLDDYVEWPGKNCDAPEFPSRVRNVQLFGDGSFGAALRDESRAGFFLASFDGRDWTQLGASFTGVQLMHANAYGPSWAIRGIYEAPDYLYCPFADAPFLPDPHPEQLLAANTLQVVPPNPDHKVVLTANPMFHDSGLCVVGDNIVYDLERGTSVELPFEPRAWSTGGE
jgi:hypothetical protein